MGMTMEDGPIYRLKKERGSEEITLLCHEDGNAANVLGTITFAALKDARDCARAILEATDDEMRFPGWNLSLHGD